MRFTLRLRSWGIRGTNNNPISSDSHTPNDKGTLIPLGLGNLFGKVEVVLYGVAHFGNVRLASGSVKTAGRVVGRGRLELPTCDL